MCKGSLPGWSGRLAAAVLAAAPGALPAAPPPAPPDVAIHLIRGPGARSPFAGRQVATRGAVTLVASDGFFLQEPEVPGAPRAARGLFVFTGAAPPAVRAGQCVRVAGAVVDFDVGAADNLETRAHPVTELHAAAPPQVLDEHCAVAPLALSWPLPLADDARRIAGLLVTLAGPWTVQQNFFLARFGQLSLAVGGRVRAPTDRVPPGPAARALAAANARRGLLLDDASAHQFPAPVPWLGAEGTVRAGDTTATVTGVVDYGLATASASGHGAWRLQAARPVAFTRANPRRPAPDAVGGRVRVAAANVDNFFATLADGRHGCAPRGLAADCRGARSEAEFRRQRAKLAAMLAALDADVVALMEIENDGGAALRSLVEALNARAGAAAWAPVAEPAGGSGGDAIRTAMIYRPARVVPAGAALADRDPAHNRPPLAQAFEAVGGGGRFALVASHFKSRRCDGAAGADRDRDDGEGCFGHRRLVQARALARFAGAVAAASGVADVLLVGDFNAYARERPLAALAAAGYADQAARFDPAGYSYVFDGAAGRLDGVFASAGMASRVTGVTTWHVDADEPDMLGYAFPFRSPGAAPPDDAGGPATPWRASDHDPVVIGLRLPLPAARSLPPASPARPTASAARPG